MVWWLSSMPVVAAPVVEAPRRPTGRLTLQRRGLIPVRAWVDATSRGKVSSPKRPLVLDLPAGAHEVWLAADDRGDVTLCRGLVDVPADGVATVEVRASMTGLSCTGLRDGWPDGPTAFRGAFVSFRIDGALDAWVSIDGGPPLAFPDAPFQLNLAPGAHSLVVYQDPDAGVVFDQGLITLQPGQQLPVTCTTAGCLGFDVPPIFITEIYERPHIVLATPGVAIDFSLDVGVPGVDAAIDVRIDP